jgi:AraC family transcriptional regulator, carnitine catabolism transcriptional activator
MLAWINQRLGRAIAMQVADQLLHFRLPQGASEGRLPAASRYGVDDPRLIAVIKLMESQVEEPVPAGELAAAAGVSLRQLERLFHNAIGQRLMGFYLKLRLERAQNLLTYSTLSMREIAVATGFSSLPEFSRAFRRHSGKAPTQFRLK